MAVLKRNLWTLCWLILLGGALLLSVILYNRWQSIYIGYQTYHMSRAQLVSQAVDSVLRTQELVLDVIGRELMRTGDVFDTSEAVPLLDNVLKVDNALIGFGLARPDGKLVRVSSNLDLSKLPNLRTYPATAESFAQTLETDTMVLGRTYYSEPRDTWTIPIRKALRNDRGEVVAVMTAGLRLGSGGGVFDKQLHNGPDDSVMLFREVDGYVQYISREDSHTSWYSRALTTMEERREKRLKYEAQLGMTEAEIKQLDKAFTLTTELNGQRTLTAAIFNPRYQLWIVSETRFKPIWQDFFAAFVQYLLIYLGISAVLLFLFRIIDNAAKKRNQELFYHSTHDDLTRILNRAGLLGKMNELLAAQKPFTVVVINVDNFKGINDRYGQEAGDQALIELARRLQTMLDSGDLLARLGGDEFVITTYNTDLMHLQTSCQTLVEKLAKSFDVGHFRIQLTASVGLAIYPEHGKSNSNLLRSAHLALYKSKQSRNSFCIYRSEMEMAYLRRLTIEQRLKYALSRDLLNMVYQPQLDEKGHMVGLEALVRWHDEELGFVSPAEFVEVAEQTGLMISLGRFVMDTSLSEYAKLRRDCGITLDLGINISVIQFEQPDFVQSVLHALNTWGIPPQELVLEVTETLVMHNFDQVLSTVKHLRREGIRISMDDFGTGYSSLSLLRKLPIDELKIDKSFVDSMLDDERAANMIQSIIYIARSHNMHVVVEGVELEKQVTALVKMGCQRFQGYYFSRPERLDKIVEMLSTGHFLMPDTEARAG
ncbi:bifunctional diguanylate cyclase/phosphodiesterase [Marinobacterium sediminicola]|uniref:Diguanylate cyclase/phosphodiesterase n=1 Tax=Marinobacterium sediminicola TaxID=518898 RepID=A0ABY1S2A7_9GAMM|nr:EAL domain-containing protein [Marinobacterium sediminicola]ULG68467.1 EAL domain-containing protein [Marinobacterium sediminicola]SMR76772.1 diguanylate cyclase/phosphodiesterase [Marinobacterium sediminicola]